MKEIPLTRGMVAFVDDADFDWLNQWKWYALKSASGVFYAARSIVKPKRECILMHQEILKALGRLQGDHRNGDKLDNQRQNLRPATGRQNRANSFRRSDNTSGFKGVSWNPQRNMWRADIQEINKHRFLGHFYGIKIAAKAYDLAALKCFGEFAKLNFPDSVNKNKT